MTTIQEIDCSVNLSQALLWQYSNSLKIQSLVLAKQAYWDRAYTNFWKDDATQDDWINNVFNLVTANEFGLAVWSIILNLPLFIPINPQPDKPIFGFNEVPTINDYVNFNRGNFALQRSAYRLTVEEQRLVLRLRYYELVSNGVMVNVDIPEGFRINAVNNFLAVLFADYPPTNPDYSSVYVLDGLDMSITYVFNFDISSQLLSVLIDYNILPRPAGVKVKYRVLAGAYFGFNEYYFDTDPPTELNTYTNFEGGNFAPLEL